MPSRKDATWRIDKVWYLLIVATNTLVAKKQTYLSAGYGNNAPMLAVFVEVGSFCRIKELQRWWMRFNSIEVEKKRRLHKSLAYQCRQSILGYASFIPLCQSSEHLQRFVGPSRYEQPSWRLLQDGALPAQYMSVEMTMKVVKSLHSVIMVATPDMKQMPREKGHIVQS